VPLVAVVHAGWKGTLAKITADVLINMRLHGANNQTIFVAIGPRIGVCCYQVGKQRAQLFSHRFKPNSAVVKRNNRYYLDLASANYQLLLENGVLSAHIDMPQICTGCNQNRFFSYRGGTSGSNGEMLGIIGIK